MQSAWAKIQAAWAWVKDHSLTILGIVVTVMGAGIFWSYHRRERRSLELDKRVAEAHAEVAALDAEREQLAKRYDERDVQIRALDTQRDVIKRNIVWRATQVGGMSDEEVEQAFQDLL